MSKKKSKKKTTQKAKPETKKVEKPPAEPAPKGWAIGAKVVAIDNEKMNGTITDPEVLASDFWKSAPASTIEAMSKNTYVRFVRADGVTFGVRKDMLKLAED
jgi:hypothetical protein